MVVSGGGGGGGRGRGLPCTRQTCQERRLPDVINCRRAWPSRCVYERGMLLLLLLGDIDDPKEGNGSPLPRCPPLPRCGPLQQQAWSSI
jgi:hypothetical protein